MSDKEFYTAKKGDESMAYHENLEKLKKVNDQLKYYKTLEALMDLDQWSSLPKQGSAYRQQVAAFVAG